MTAVVGGNYNMVICGQSQDKTRHYRGRIEKVKFGVPVSEAFAHDIPATLLVLLLKVNKEGPMKKDIWRAPGNQAQVRKLIQVMQHGRLVNIANFSVYTAASVVKKFLSKLPGGIFGCENEERLFSLLDVQEGEKRRDAFCRVISNLSVPSQHLLVLLFGTFRLISDGADSYGTKMSPEALGVSVAPSLFLSCILDGQRAKLEDVVRFRMASQVVSWLIKAFGSTNLFPRDDYEYYARITGRTLRVDENWTFTFSLPSSDLYLQRQWLKTEAEKMGCYNLTGALSEPHVDLDRDGELSPCSEDDLTLQALSHTHPVSYAHTMPRGYPGRLGGSVGEVLLGYPYDDGLRDYLSPPPCGSMDQLRTANRLAESTKSLSYLGWVHERQTKRMQCRSEWFLSPTLPIKNGCHSSRNKPNPNSSSQSIDTGLYQRTVQRKRSWRLHYVRRREEMDATLRASALDDDQPIGDSGWVQLTVATVESTPVSTDPSPLLPDVEESPPPLDATPKKAYHF